MASLLWLSRFRSHAAAHARPASGFSTPAKVGSGQACSASARNGQHHIQWAAGRHRGREPQVYLEPSPCAVHHHLRHLAPFEPVSPTSSAQRVGSVRRRGHVLLGDRRRHEEPARADRGIVFARTAYAPRLPLAPAKVTLTIDDSDGALAIEYRRGGSAGSYSRSASRFSINAIDAAAC